MDITIEEALQSFGFSPKEIKIYLACLELGTATGNEIANKSIINRSTTYDILKLLVEKGIASKLIKNNTTHFEVVGPMKLIAQLEEKKAKLNSVLDKLKVIEERVIKKPIVEVYEGHEGIKTIFEDILLTKKEVEVISTSKIFEVLNYYFPNYIIRRKEERIFTRVIQEESPKTKEVKKKDKNEFRKTKAIENMDINSATFIYGDKFAIIRLVKNELIGILTWEKNLAEDQRKLFEILWNQAK
ncbi:MAG: hypothetical protein KJ939_00580 [Nanoarchaeota archaeon]|nr:hypothetical protein [Nanoarchaeota archaeon]MBU4351564.1 hypothetical protein [Nanoarchaeota archaeon]